MSEYILMHKNIEVALMELDENDRNAKPMKISINNREKDHIPIGARMNNIKFINWWQDRAIPKTRQGAKTALQRLGYNSVTNVMIENLALSLNDCYWIKPRHSELTWEEVNLFDNNFVDLFGELTFNQTEDLDLRKYTKFLSAVSQGEVQKKWCIDKDNHRYLVKGNYGNSYQQSINEIFASEFHKQQGFKNYTPYYFTKIELTDNREGLGCFSYNFCNENIESISAWELLQTKKIRQNESLYYPFKEVCISLGIKEDIFNNFIDYQICSDFLFTNLDRHMNNISILRNPDTLDILGFAPIYDSGNSMFYNIPYTNFNNIKLGQDKTHSFITSKENRLLRYVTDRNIIDLDKINMDFSIYEKDTSENQIRILSLQEKFERKIDMLSSFQKGNSIWKDNYNNNYISIDDKNTDNIDTLEDNINLD